LPVLFLLFVLLTAVGVCVSVIDDTDSDALNKDDRGAVLLARPTDGTDSAVITGAEADEGAGFFDGSHGKFSVGIAGVLVEVLAVPTGGMFGVAFCWLMVVWALKSNLPKSLYGFSLLLLLAYNKLLATNKSRPMVTNNNAALNNAVLNNRGLFFLKIIFNPFLFLRFYKLAEQPEMPLSTASMVMSSFEQMPPPFWPAPSAIVMLEAFKDTGSWDLKTVLCPFPLITQLITEKSEKVLGIVISSLTTISGAVNIRLLLLAATISSKFCSADMVYGCWVYPKQNGDSLINTIWTSKDSRKKILKDIDNC